jgi:hypothetical protein
VVVPDEWPDQQNAAGAISGYIQSPDEHHKDNRVSATKMAENAAMVRGTVRRKSAVKKRPLLIGPVNWTVKKLHSHMDRRRAE